jgi:hypothetical protein
MVALAQAEYLAGGRSRCLASLTAAIIKAAEHDPPPDLIVLPDCHRLHLVVSGAILHTPAMCQVVTETLSLLAREWGVWIVAGHDVHLDGQVTAGATLFDPDGDAYIRHPEDRREPPGEEAEPVERPWTARSTPMGRIALFVGDSAALEPPSRVPLSKPLDLFIIPSGAESEGPDGPRLSALAKALNACVCAVFQRGPCGQRPTNNPGLMVGRDGKDIPGRRSGSSRLLLSVVEMDMSPITIDTKLEGLGHFE